MIRAIVGHRGTGKSELVKRMQFYWRETDTQFVDLDLEIEKKVGKTIRELFMENGEEYFRNLESQLFTEFIQRPDKNLAIVLGAGFPITMIPEHIQVLWVKRQTDLEGRIFLDRPRLEAEKSPLMEFQKRAFTRESQYRARSDEVYLMPEGLFENRHYAQEIEKALLSNEVKSLNAGISLQPGYLERPLRWKIFKSKFAGKKLRFIELRDDLLSFSEMKRIQSELPEETFLYSFRTEQNWQQLPAEFFEVFSKCQWMDWAFELGSAEQILKIAADKFKILSLHNEIHFDAWTLECKKLDHAKFAPKIDSFVSLAKYHDWQKLDPNNRTFLPSSESGRWEWYRLLQKSSTAKTLCFVKEDNGTASDQPTLWKWMAAEIYNGSFAALLGNPAHHSLTPLEHSDFFHERKIPIVAIPVDREEWQPAINFLDNLGLKYAAVTSPLKELAASFVKRSSEKAVNTLYKSGVLWKGISTDFEGFQLLIEGSGMIAPLQTDIFVWGGGGTLDMIQKSLPRARYFSSRTGTERVPQVESSLAPKVVIWAAPRSADTQFPPVSWKPQIVYDLNYKEDSMGREYAQKLGVAYESGLAFFQEQARYQRLFWKQAEENSL